MTILPSAQTAFRILNLVSHQRRTYTQTAMTADTAMQTYYAARAAEYDRIYQKPERQGDLRAIEAWLPPHFAGKNVVEVACGTGYWTQFIAPVAWHVVAVDAAPETMEIAKTRGGMGAVQFVTGDAYALQAAPAVAGLAEGAEGAGGAEGARQFDAAFAGFWYSHVPKARQPAFLKGLCSVLKPGSKVLLLDNRFVAGSSSPISDTDADGNTYQTRPLDDGSSHRVLKNFPTDAELLASVASLGEQARVTQWPYFWALVFKTRTF